MNELTISRVINHLEKTYELFYIWDSIMRDKALSKKVFENKVLGIMNYSSLQLLHIKISIFFERNGKHAIEKLIKDMPESRIKSNLNENWERFRADNKEIIEKVKFLRDKYYAHYDEIHMQEVYANLQSNENLLMLLDQVQIMLISICMELYQKGPKLFDPKEIQQLTKDSLK